MASNGDHEPPEPVDPDGSEPMAAEPMAAEPMAAKDATYGDEWRPVRLTAQDAEDLAVISALLQDAVALSGDLAFLPKERRFALVANRYRWEDPKAQERIRVGVHFDHVLRARVKGLEPAEKKRPLSILSVSFEPGPTPPGGVIRINCAGAVEAMLEVEAIEGALRDMSAPWSARGRPRHP